MSDAPDKTDKMARIRLEELARLEDTGKVILQANEALVVHELRRVLACQAEGDLVIKEMHVLINKLVDGHMLAVDEIGKLKAGHAVLQLQYAELYERTDIIGAACDAMADRLSQTRKEHEQLADEIADRD